MFFAALLLAYTHGDVEVEIHAGYTVIGCAAKPSEGLGPPAYYLYSVRDESEVYETHSFTLTRSGDAVTSSGGFVCLPGYGLPALYVVDNGVVGP